MSILTFDFINQFQRQVKVFEKICTRALLFLLTLLLTEGHASYGDFQQEDELKKWDVFADFLVWHLDETNTQWAFVTDPKFTAPPAAPFTGSFDTFLKAVTFDWSPGVRAGLSYTLPHDLWNTRFYYTWYQTSATSHLTPSSGNVIQSQFIATDFLLTLPGFSLSFEEAKIRWDVSYNMFNWDFGRACKLGECLTLRPHLGIQGGWIHQDIRADWIQSDTLISYNAQETLKHHFWGVGPEVGMNSKWNLRTVGNHMFSIWGDFSQVFMWGHWSFNEEAFTTIDVNTINTQPDREMGSLTFQGAAGLVWDYCCDRTLFTLKLGYEIQIWMQQLQFFQHFSGLLHNALTLQGGTFRFQFSY